MDREDILSLADILEQAGYEDALGLIEVVLLPKAVTDCLSLRNAMNNHADPEEDGDTSASQLYRALTKADASSLASLDIDEIVKKIPL